MARHLGELYEFSVEYVTLLTIYDQQEMSTNLTHSVGM